MIPHRKVRFASFPVLLFLLWFSSWGARAAIRYRVSLAHPERHLFHVRMLVPHVAQELTVAIPAWNALYQIRDFGFRVSDVRARKVEGGGGFAWLQVTKLDKQTWRIAGPAEGGVRTGLGSVEVDYAIYWDSPGPFSSQLNPHHAFLNLAEVLFYIPDRRAEETYLTFRNVPAAWKAAAELDRAQGLDSFRAESYDRLVDAPVELGDFDESQFAAPPARIRVVVDGGPWKKRKLEEALKRIVRYEISLMRGAPFAEYLFIFHFGSTAEVGSGGMEHANSAAIAEPSDDAAIPVAAHEFFHLWNVKRIRPKSLEPVNYAKEQWTRSLWFAEGVTSTYAAYALERCGLWSRGEFYRDLAAQLAELDSRPARAWQSVEESSLDAWLEKYDYYNRPERSISYYNKGQVLGVLLDLEIRDATNNHASLDDLMRVMNDRFAKPGRFYRGCADIEALAEEISGRSLKDFFRRYVSGTDEIPYEQFLALAGLRLKKGERTFADLGFLAVRGVGTLPSVADLDPTSPAAAAGVREGDELLRLNDKEFPRGLGRWLERHSPGETVSLVIRRGHEERRTSFALGSRAWRSYEIIEDSSADARQKRIREGLLRGATD